MSEHKPGPWIALSPAEWDKDGQWVVPGVALCGKAELSEANARLIAAAPDMLAALQAVNKLVSEAAMIGFNCLSGDWAERLFASQQGTHAAIVKATNPEAKP